MTGISRSDFSMFPGQRLAMPRSHGRYRNAVSVRMCRRYSRSIRNQRQDNMIVDKVTHVNINQAALWSLCQFRCVRTQGCYAYCALCDPAAHVGQIGAASQSLIQVRVLGPSLRMHRTRIKLISTSTPTLWGSCRMIRVGTQVF